MTEEWLPIPGYEGYYEASSFGRVRSVDRVVAGKSNSIQNRPGHILTRRFDSKGYALVTLSKNGQSSSAKVSRLVAKAFLPNPFNFPVVNHKDENKSNDAADNLEWCTYSYNSRYGTAIARRSAKRRIPVVQLDFSGNEIANYDGAICAELETGIDHSHITRCCRGKLKQTGGYVWKYANKYEQGETT